MMRTFKQFLREVKSWEKNTLFAIGPNGPVEYFDDITNETGHPDAFKHLNFNYRPNSEEEKYGIETLRDDIAKDSPFDIHRPHAQSWGRIDHKNKTIHIVTQNGALPYGTLPHQNHKRRKEDDIFHRIDAAKKLKEKYPDYLIQHKVKQISSEIFEPTYLTHSAYERTMMGLLQ